MFGYILPQKAELRVRELNLYNAHYCALCNALARLSGEASRLTLNYDCTFLGILLSAFEEAKPCEPRRCLYKPFSKPRPMAVQSESLRFVAALSVIFAWHKLDDDWRDERRPAAVVARGALQAAFEKSKRQYPAIAQATERGILSLRALEQEGSIDIDAPADAFASMLRSVVLLSKAPAGRERPAVGALAYNMGRWIYLMDAWNDRERDCKTGAYNPFNRSRLGSERARFAIDYSLSQAQSAYELIDLRSNREVLENILYCGCPAKSAAIFGGVG